MGVGQTSPGAVEDEDAELPLRVGVLVPATTGFYEDGQTGQEVQ